jgi:O-antigen/teichoic acid export membrane protein
MKHRLDDVAASHYGRAALVAKSFLYLASALNMVLLPAVASARAKGGAAEARRALGKFLAAALGMELLGLALVWAATPLVIRVLCGGDPSFTALAPLVRIFSAAVLPLALAQLVLYYLLAARDYRVLFLLAVVAAAYAVLLAQAGAEAIRVVGGLGLSATALLLVSLWMAFSPADAGLQRT